MVLMNLFAAMRDTDLGDMCVEGMEEKQGLKERVAWKHIH